ncbi:M14 family metallopeptidase [Gaetbulibacter aestuarii]|uniref:M14 metallopeptidase family protein n=1 Tax=Gaetbulibacter aestuarii TaxID=1502358 RepID=A0ABW7N0S6_9FLAO
MQPDLIKKLFQQHKEPSLFGRYITNGHIEPLLKNLSSKVSLSVIGRSVLNKPIYGLKIGEGSKRLLLWSQMHGNESTTTKALFDLLNTLSDSNSSYSNILKACTFYIIPILNPDGAERYTRLNANEIDLNRDAQDLTQPESRVLRDAFNAFKPDYCFNLHGQRTIFSAGKTNHPATVSFLAPAQDHACTITENRKIAMELIGVMNAGLQFEIPNQVGVYDDAFNLNCVGDTFQSLNVPTVLFEAGHYNNDYQREFTRELIYRAYLLCFDYISNNNITGTGYKPYLDIPENDKCFYDIIIRNTLMDNKIIDVAIQYEERLVDNTVFFVPMVQKIESLPEFYGHKEIDAEGSAVLSADGMPLKLSSENVFVMLNNEKITLLVE